MKGGILRLFFFLGDCDSRRRHGKLRSALSFGIMLLPLRYVFIDFRSTLSTTRVYTSVPLHHSQQYLSVNDRKT